VPQYQSQTNDWAHEKWKTPAIKMLFFKSIEFIFSSSSQRRSFI